MEEPQVEEPKVEESIVSEEVTVAEIQPEGEAVAELPAAEAMVEVVAADPSEVPALVPVPIQAKKKRRSSGTVPRWTAAEEETLSALVREHGERSWTLIADKLDNHRSAGAIDQHWSIMTGKRKREPKPSEPKEKKEKEEKPVVPKPPCEEGVEADKEGGGDESVPKKKRERRSLGKAQRWTAEEEVKLKEYVAELGAHGHWTTIAERLETGRSGGGVEQHWQIMAGRRKPRGSKTINAMSIVPASVDDSAMEVSATAENGGPTPVLAEASVATAESAPPIVDVVDAVAVPADGVAVETVDAVVPPAEGAEPAAAVEDPAVTVEAMAAVGVEPMVPVGGEPMAAVGVETMAAVGV